MYKLQKMFLGAMLAFALALVSPVVSTADTDKGLSALLDEVGATQVSDERAGKIRGELSYTQKGYSWLWYSPSKDGVVGSIIGHRVVYFTANGSIRPEDITVYKNGQRTNWDVYRQGSVYVAMVPTEYASKRVNWRTWMKGVTLRSN